MKDLVGIKHRGKEKLINKYKLRGVVRVLINVECILGACKIDAGYCGLVKKRRKLRSGCNCNVMSTLD